MNPTNCLQPLHICECLACDTERRNRVRAAAEKWFEEATWRLLRRQAQERLDKAAAEALNDAIRHSYSEPPASGVYRTATRTTHRGLRPIRHKVAT